MGCRVLLGCGTDDGTRHLVVDGAGTVVVVAAAAAGVGGGSATMTIPDGPGGPCAPGSPATPGGPGGPTGAVDEGRDEVDGGARPDVGDGWVLTGGRVVVGPNSSPGLGSNTEALTATATINVTAKRSTSAAFIEAPH